MTPSAREPAFDVLAQLRGDAEHRPAVDPGLAGGLREWLEDGVSPVAAHMPGAGRPLIITPEQLTGTPERRADEGTWSRAAARDALLRKLFRQQVTTGRIDDPVAEALGAARADGDDALVSFVGSLARTVRTVFDHELTASAALLADRWQLLAPAWLPRTGERISIPLAGGRVLLVAEVDLTLGLPSTGLASVCVVRVSGEVTERTEATARRFLALLETIRSGAPPRRVATYGLADGRLQAEDVPDHLLASAVDSVIAAINAAPGVPGGRSAVR